MLDPVGRHHIAKVGSGRIVQNVRENSFCRILICSATSPLDSLERPSVLVMGESVLCAASMEAVWVEARSVADPGVTGIFVHQSCHLSDWAGLFPRDVVAVVIIDKNIREYKIVVFQGAHVVLNHALDPLEELDHEASIGLVVLWIDLVDVFLWWISRARGAEGHSDSEPRRSSRTRLSTFDVLSLQQNHFLESNKVK